MAFGRAKILKAIEEAGIEGDEQLIAEIVSTARDTDNPLAFVRDYAESMAIGDGGEPSGNGGEPSRRVPTAMDDAEETGANSEFGSGNSESKAESGPLEEPDHDSPVTCEASEDVIEVMLALTIPLAAKLPSGYRSNHLDAQLKPEQAAMLKRLTYGLNQKDVRTKDGRHVHTPADAIRWLLENIA